MSQGLLCRARERQHHTTGQSVGDTITPEKDAEQAAEGSKVKLSCRYSSSQVYSLLWYRQYPGSFILLKGAKSRSSVKYIPNNRYGSKTSDSSTELTITGLTLADTALYYCALDTQ
uniref:Ig-like domain-containing protein n=1 Tax=Myripristis murdjan TaxID=586833 RepID=A0A667ZRC8_9TELE